MSTETSNITVEVADLIRRARQAQEAIERYTQQQVDALTTAVAWSVVRQDRAEALAKLAVDEGGFGNYADKVTKIRNRVMGTLADIAGVKTVGVVEELPEKGLIKIAKPVGVVAALIPTTGPDATPPLKTLLALKGRNAIIIAAHPRTQKTTALVVQYMREACTQIGAPADLVQLVDKPSLAKTQELMRQADLIVATGGEGMVKAAYSSGTPAYGVGVGNSVHVVDETADLEDAAKAIATAKTFDYATSCLADNAVVVAAAIYKELVAALVAQGAHICDAVEKARLQRLMWPEAGSSIPSVAVVAKPATQIADMAGISVPSNRRFLDRRGRWRGVRSPVLGREAIGRSSTVPLRRRYRRRRAAGQCDNQLPGTRSYLRDPHAFRGARIGPRARNQDRKGARQSKPQRGCRQPEKRAALHAEPKLRHLGR